MQKAFYNCIRALKKSFKRRNAFFISGVIKKVECFDSGYSFSLFSRKRGMHMKKKFDEHPEEEIAGDHGRKLSQAPPELWPAPYLKRRSRKTAGIKCKPLAPKDLKRITLKHTAAHLKVPPR